MRKIMTRVAIALLLAIPSLTVRMVSAADPIKSVQISNSEWTGEAKDLGPMWMTIDSVTSDGYVIGQINMRTWFRKLGNFQPDAASGNAKIDGNTITIRMSVSTVTLTISGNTLSGFYEGAGPRGGHMKTTVLLTRK